MVKSLAIDAGSGSVVVGEELKAVLSTDLGHGELMTIEAVAGAGKSTALREYARRRPLLRFLYVCLNVDVKDEKDVKKGRKDMKDVKEGRV